jgi:phosphonate transport system substrate-binding protein
MRKKLFALLFLLVCLSCKNNTDLDSNGEPKEIVIAVFGGSGDNNGSVKKSMEVFAGYLEKKLNKKVRVYITTNYTSVIEALHSKKAHIGYLSPFSYVLAAQKNDITPMVVIGQMGKQSIYHSIIFANKNSGVFNIDQLKLRAKELTLSFSDPASTSGHLIPFAYLNSIGINPDSSFKQIIFAGSHAATVLSVASNKVDIGCSTREFGTEILIRKGLIKSNDINILWESEPIVASPIVIRKDINKVFAEKIKNIYLNLSKDDYSVFNSYISLFHTNANELSYIPVEDSLYNGVRNITKSIKDVELLKNH